MLFVDPAGSSAPQVIGSQLMDLGGRIPRVLPDQNSVVFEAIVTPPNPITPSSVWRRSVFQARPGEEINRISDPDRDTFLVREYGDQVLLDEIGEMERTYYVANLVDESKEVVVDGVPEADPLDWIQRIDDRWLFSNDGELSPREANGVIATLQGGVDRADLVPQRFEGAERIAFQQDDSHHVVSLDSPYDIRSFRLADSQGIRIQGDQFFIEDKWVLAHVRERDENGRLLPGDLILHDVDTDEQFRILGLQDSWDGMSDSVTRLDAFYPFEDAGIIQIHTSNDEFLNVFHFDVSQVPEPNGRGMMLMAVLLVVLLPEYSLRGAREKESSRAPNSFAPMRKHSRH